MAELDDEVMLAARRGDVNQLQKLVAQGFDVKSHGGIALFCAIGNQNTAAVKCLLDHGAQVNVPEYGWDALHLAADRGLYEIMRLLLAAGANVHSSSRHKTPLCYAVLSHRMSNAQRASQLLLSYGARVDAFGAGQTPLWHAIRRGQRELIKLFLRAGAREIATADLPARDFRSVFTLDLIATIRAAGGWKEYVAKHRRVLAGLVSKLSAKSVVPLDAASHLVGFWCPPGGY